MAVITEVESDDELPPLVGSQVTSKAQAEPDSEEDEDELPPLISSEAPVQVPKPAPAPAKPVEAPAAPASKPGPRGLGSGVTRREVQEPARAAPAPAPTPAPVRSPAPAPTPAPVRSPAPVPAPERLESGQVEVDRIVSKDDLDDAIDVLEDGHFEEAELLAGEVRTQAAREGDAEREADALRVVTKAQIKEAESRGFEGLPDVEALEGALKASSSEAFSFEKKGQVTAKAITQLGSAEVCAAMDSHIQALQLAQQALSSLQQAGAAEVRVAMAHRCLADIYFAQGRYSLVVQETNRVKQHITKPSTMLEARELAAALLTCAKARANASEAQAADVAQEALTLCERMGDARNAAIAACEEAKAYNGMKLGQAAGRKAASRAVALAKETCDSKIEAAAWLASCNALQSAGQRHDALKAGRQALTLAREAKDLEVIGQAVQALLSCSEPEKVAGIAEEEVMMAKKVGDYRREAYAQKGLATAMLMQERPREALRRATDCAERLKQLGDLKGEAKALHFLVELQCQARQTQEAQRAAKDAQRLYKEVGNFKGAVAVLQLLTALHLESGANHDAIQCARDQVKVYREAGFKEEEAAATLGLAEMMQQTMGPRDALRLCKDAASLSRAAGDIAGEARALAQVTQMHLALKATSMATKTATEAEELARQSGDPRTLCTTLQACAEAETAADRFTEALQMAKEALQLAEKAVKDEPMRASALACLGSVHLQMGHYDVNNPGVRSRPRGLKECLKVSEEALALHRKLGDRSGEMGGVQRIFHAHLIGQDGPASLRYAREYMEMAQQSDQKDNLGPALVSLCQAHFLCRNYEEAERANVEARAIFEKSRSHENIEVCDQIMRELKQEMARDQRPTQPMGKAHTAVGVGGFGYNSLLPERQQARSPPSGPGLPVGGFAAAGTEMPAPEKTTPSNDKSAQRFSDGLRGAFSRQSAAAAAAARSAPEPAPVPAPAPTRSAPAMNGSTANARNGSAMNGAGTSSSSYSGRSAAGSGALGGPRSGGLGAGGLGSSRSSGYGRANGSGSYGGSSYGGGLGSSSSRYGSYGSSANSTRPGYGAPAGVPAGGFGGRGVPAGGFGGASAPERSAPQDAERRSGRSAFAGFSRSDRSTGGEE